MTLEKIRAALPTHIMLTPGVHRWQEGDEAAVALLGMIVFGALRDNWYGKTVLRNGIGRRPIPTHILDNQAFWILLDRGFEACDHFADKAENLGVVKKLGGLDNYRKQRKAGRLYDKWLLEQMEDV